MLASRGVGSKRTQPACGNQSSGQECASWLVITQLPSRCWHARGEADGDPGRDADDAGQHHHRAGELLAVPGVRYEQELAQRIVAGRGTVQVVVEGRAAQVRLDRRGLVVLGPVTVREVMGELVHPRPEGRRAASVLGATSGGSRLSVADWARSDSGVGSATWEVTV